MKVNVKWGKELYKDVEVDLQQPPLVFKSQIFTLSGVPPDRQKVLIKGGQLKDDDWGKQQPKEGMTIMMMGSAEEVKVDAPANMPKFVEDLPEEEQNTLETKAYGSGLKNLGNTCYMNSTVQCLYSIHGLRDAVLDFNPEATAAAGAGTSSLAGADTGKKLVAATQELFSDLKRGGEPFPPFKFLLSLRQRFPQFAQQTNEGFYMQQDAEECWTNVMYTLKEGLKVRAPLLVADTTTSPSWDNHFPALALLEVHVVEQRLTSLLELLQVQHGHCVFLSMSPALDMRVSHLNSSLSRWHQLKQHIFNAVFCAGCCNRMPLVSPWLTSCLASASLPRSSARRQGRSSRCGPQE